MTLLALAVSVAGGARPVRAQTLYTVKDLGTLGGSNSFGQAVNNSGQVAGSSGIAGDQFEHAFLSGPGGGPLQDLGTLGGSNSVGYAVNASGQVAGGSDLAGNQQGHAFLSGPGGGPLKDLGTLPGFTSSFAYGVNASGQVAGTLFLADGSSGHAFLSGPGGGPLQDLGTLGGSSSYGYAVNASGQVAGISGHAFLSGPGGGPLKDLGTLGGSLSIGLAVNDSGQVAGESASAIAPVFSNHAFLSGPGGGPLKDLGTLGGVFSIGRAVNASGQVVGGTRNADGLLTVFLYSDGQMFDLNNLIAPGSGLRLYNASGISDTGYITGSGSTSDGSLHAFLLIPVPSVTCTVAVPQLWPPNNKLIDVGLGARVKPAEDTLHLQVYANDGAIAADAADLGPGALRLRAERQGGGQGRVYLIVATATDAAGGSGFDVCTVVVPHDQSDASLATVQAAAAAAQAYYREFQAAPTGYALIAQAAPN
jgi:probable HAF family extracellular repeat protein